MLSTVLDLLKYGNQMLLFYQNESKENKLFLQSSTMKSLVWTAQSNPTEKLSNEAVKPLGEPNDKLFYGMGWYVSMFQQKLKYVYHTGGAVGAVSCLLIVPTESSSNSEQASNAQGLVVSVICNSQNTNEIVKFARQISLIFSDN